MGWSDVTDWFGDHGWAIVVIVALWLLGYFILHHFIPPIIKRTVLMRMRGQDKEEVMAQLRALGYM